MTTVSSTDSTSALSTYLSNQTSAVASDSTSSTSSSSENSWASVTGDFNTFLQILIAQLQNQDPLDAADTDQFTQQLVQFAGIEQQIAANDKLDTLIDQGDASVTQSMLGYIGKSVEAASTDDQVIVQNGTMQMAYNLDSSASSVTVKIYNSSGELVTTLSGCPTNSGVNRITWDGELSDGSTASDGVYTFSISAKDSDGNAMSVTDTRMIGVVTGMTIDSTNGNTLMVGTLEVKESNVDAVFDASTSTASTTDEDSSSSS